MVSGIVRMTLYPLVTAIAARPMPVFPDVGSMMVAPGASLPSFSASSIMALATLSFTEPAGLKYSSFAYILALSSYFFSIFTSSRRGVPPTSWAMDVYTFICCLPCAQGHTASMRFCALIISFLRKGCQAYAGPHPANCKACMGPFVRFPSHKSHACAPDGRISAQGCRSPF